MGLMSLPILINQGYEKSFSAGLVASTGTLGQIIPPSIALVLLGDVMSNAYQRAQNDMGIFSQQTVTVGDLFIGAIVPGIMICLGYLIYTIYKNKQNLNLKDYSNNAPIKKIEILNNSDKSPCVSVKSLNHIKFNISISHEKKYAIAFALIEK